MKKEILKTLENYLKIDKCFITEDEQLNLEKQIAYLKEEIRIDAHREYVKQLKEFRKYMSDTFDTLMADDASDENVTEFYQSQFQITWRGITITLDNSATVFQNMDDLLEIEIDENEVF